MRRVIVILLLCCTSALLLAAAGIGVLVARSDPQAYARRLSAIVEESTGRQLLFQGDVVTTLFPSPGLRAGRLVMLDPGIFGGEAFLTVEEASLSLALQPLLQGVLHIEEIVLHKPVLRLATTSSGRHNWEHGFASGLSPSFSAGEGPHPPGQELGREGRGAPSVFSTAVRSSASPEGAVLSLFQVERLRCSEARIIYRDMRSGASYEGALDSVVLRHLGQGGDVPFAATGETAGENDNFDARFVVEGLLRLDTVGGFAARLNSFDLELRGLGKKTLSLSSQGSLSYDPALRECAIHDLQGELDGKGFGGRFSLGFPSGNASVSVNGDLHVDGIALDDFMEEELFRAAPSSVGPVRGAPNMSRPVVVLPAGREAAPERFARHEKNAGLKAEEDEEKGQVPLTRGIAGKLALTFSSLRYKQLSIPRLQTVLDFEGEQVHAPFSMELLRGTASGAVRINWSAELPSLACAAVARDIAMEELSELLTDEHGISGPLSLEIDVSGKGTTWRELAPSLAGRVSAQVQGGEIRGFALVPPHVQGAEQIPSRFAFDRLSGSAFIERGIASSKDIALSSTVLAFSGGGAANFVLEHLDIDLDIMTPGRLSGIPVVISGSFSSLSHSVSRRALPRAAAGDRRLFSDP